MNANPKFLAAQAHVDEAAVQPFPGSRKVHVGPLRVPMREIAQTGDNPPILVYDTSGPYTDPAAKIDIRAGLPALREPWIERRDDTSGPYTDPAAKIDIRAGLPTLREPWIERRDDTSGPYTDPAAKIDIRA